MSDCLGHTPVSAKTDREMSKWLSAGPDSTGCNPALTAVTDDSSPVVD
jgi:hypothetical protein